MSESKIKNIVIYYDTKNCCRYIIIIIHDLFNRLKCIFTNFNRIIKI